MDIKKFCQILLVLSILVSCSNDKVIKYLSANQEQIISEFTGTTVIIRGDNVIYQIKEKNNYSTYQFRYSDSLSFKDKNRQPKEMLLIKSHLKKKMELMSKFHIKSYTSDFQDFGIELKLYLEDGRSILVVNNLQDLDDRYKNYVSSSKKLTDKLYLVQEIESYE